jgi:hypothetical protein
MIFSLEYAHYDGSSDIQDVIDFTNCKIGDYIALHPSAQKTIMFDDIHSQITHDNFYQSMQALDKQPDCIYLESAFGDMMQQIFETLEADGFTYTQEDGKDYLRKDEKRYNQFTTFLVRSESKERKIFSCPALVAASYLYKLGHFKEIITGQNGTVLKTSKIDEVLTILPARYLQVEANARSIIELISPDYLKRLNYIFY